MTRASVREYATAVRERYRRAVKQREMALAIPGLARERRGRLTHIQEVETEGLAFGRLGQANRQIRERGHQ